MLIRASLGFGLGLRVDHYETILNERPAVDWFEALTENYLVPGGKPLHNLTRIREHYPMVMHGVSMSIGSTQRLDRAYLDQVKALAARIEPAWISDHLCWTGVGGKNLHDLLPLPYTDEALRHVVERVRTVQDILGRRILLENVSSYVSFRTITWPRSPSSACSRSISPATRITATISSTPTIFPCPTRFGRCTRLPCGVSGQSRP